MAESFRQRHKLAALIVFDPKRTLADLLDQALRSARPPVFFQRQPSIRRQLRPWDAPALQNAAAAVHAAVTEIRQRPALETPLAERTILALARRAQTRRRQQAERSVGPPRQPVADLVQLLEGAVPDHHPAPRLATIIDLDRQPQCL